MEEQELIDKMLELFRATLKEEGGDDRLELNADTPLVGADAVITSLGLVSSIVDLESLLAETYSIDVTLVSEDALSRSQSPFLSINALADYIFELSAAPEALAK